jgi:hypothetical protein
MSTKRLVRLSFLCVVLILGIAVGQSLILETLNAARRPLGDHELAIHAAHSAMDLMKADLERAGYTETIPPSRGADAQGQVRVNHDDDLVVVAASGKTLSFRSPDGRNAISYEFDGRRLVRVADGESEVLLEDVRDFQVRPESAGQAINVAFWTLVGPQTFDGKSGVAPVYGRFVHTQEQASGAIRSAAILQ